MESLNLNMEKSEGLSITKLNNDVVITSEVSEEFSLPDYIPEIRKLLVVKAQVLPESKYLESSSSNSKLDLSGLVTYNVIYTDDEGRLCSIPLNTAYEASGELNSTPNGVIVDTTVDSTVARVTDKRKISIKTRLKSRVLSMENMEIQENISPRSSADEMFLQRMGKTVRTLKITQISNENIKLSDKFDMQGIKDVKPVWCDASIIINEVRPQQRSVLVRGSVAVKCICRTQDGTTTFVKNMTLNEEIEAENCTPASMVSCEGRCVSLSISNELSDDTSQLFFDLSCELEGVCVNNNEELAVCDCYSTKHEAETKYRIIDTYQGVKCQNTSFTVSEAVKRKNNDVKEIIEVIARGVCEKTELKGRKLCLNGKIELNIIGKTEENENGESEYVGDSYEVPFKYETDVGDFKYEYITRSIPAIESVNARYDNERLLVNCEVYLKQDIFARESVEILDSCIIKKDTEFKNDASCVRVFFPKEGDTLWQIAKKYHTTTAHIAMQNGLSGENDDLKPSLLI